jgi:phage baseplate assembly protein W
MAYPQVPKISFPFRMVNNAAATVEQNSDDEITDSVQVLLSTEVGSREEVPAYGIPEQAFLQNGADAVVLLNCIREWEPRATTVLTPEQIVDFAQITRVGVLQREING